jgi:hypothetical protein
MKMAVIMKVKTKSVAKTHNAPNPPCEKKRGGGGVVVVGGGSIGNMVW